MTTDRHSYCTLRVLTFFLAVGLAGCAGGYGSSDSGTGSAGDTPAFKAETEGQRFLLERTQERDAMLKKTQQADAPAPESASQKACEGFPGFDRGCPGGGK
jgi:hypothetical protein